MDRRMRGLRGSDSTVVGTMKLCAPAGVSYELCRYGQDYGPGLLHTRPWERSWTIKSYPCLLLRGGDSTSSQTGSLRTSLCMVKLPSGRTIFSIRDREERDKVRAWGAVLRTVHLCIYLFIHIYQRPPQYIIG